MKNLSLAALLSTVFLFPCRRLTRKSPRAPLALHPDNPHYFLFRGKPTVLITSGEHYGAVLNLDFDYLRYLDALHDRRAEPHPHLGRHLPRDPRLVRDHRQHSGAAARPLPLPLGPQLRPAGLLRRREQVRPDPLGRELFRAA